MKMMQMEIFFLKSKLSHESKHFPKTIRNLVNKWSLVAV